MDMLQEEDIQEKHHIGLSPRRKLVTWKYHLLRSILWRNHHGNISLQIPSLKYLLTKSSEKYLLVNVFENIPTSLQVCSCKNVKMCVKGKPFLEMHSRNWLHKNSRLNTYMEKNSSRNGFMKNFVENIYMAFTLCLSTPHSWIDY